MYVYIVSATACLQSPWELVGRSAWSARIGSRALFPSDRNGGGKGVNRYAGKGSRFPHRPGDAMRILHTTHNSMVQVSYGVLSPSLFSLGRHRTTQTRVLPPSRASTATPSARANGVCRRVRLRPRLEQKGGHASLVVGVEHRLIKEEVVSCARHAKSKSVEWVYNL